MPEPQTMVELFEKAERAVAERRQILACGKRVAASEGRWKAAYKRLYREYGPGRHGQLSSAARIAIWLICFSVAAQVWVLLTSSYGDGLLWNIGFWVGRPFLAVQIFHIARRLS